MADRTVVVRLKASITDFQAGMAAAGKSVSAVQSQLADGNAKQKAGLQQVSRGMMLVGAAGVAAAGLAVKAFVGFDKEMSNVKAVSGAAAGQMDKLRDAALKAGADTVFSASEAAKAEAELARAGVKTADILGGALRGSLDLAAAGQLELADAATISAQAMNIFDLKGKDVAHIADVLAAGANKSAADVKGLGDALRQGGLVAAQTGAGLEDTVGVLAAFADNALIGSDAGTSLKTMLQRLTPDSEKAAGAMADIGLHAYDAAGNFVGLEAVAGQLQTGLGKLTEEQRAATLKIIFGSDAVRAANVLYEEGAAGVDEYTRAVNDNGAATRTAAIQLDNLAGDLEALKGSIETALIQSGSSANGVLRGLTQEATGLVNGFAGAPKIVQNTGLAFAALGGSTLLALGALGTIIPKVRQARDTLKGLGAAGEVADKGLGKFGKGLGIATAALVAYEAASHFLGESTSDLSNFTSEVEAAAGATTQSKIAGLTAEMKRLNAESKEGILNGEVFGYGVQIGLDANRAKQRVFALEDRIKALKHEQKLANIEAKNGESAAEGFGNALEDVVSPAVEDASKALEDYAGWLDTVNGVNISAARSQIELGEAFVDLKKKVGDTTKVTDEETLALLDFADQSNQTAKAILDQTGEHKDMSDSLKESRRRFMDTAVAMGHTKEEARDLADKWLSIPKKYKTDYTTTGIEPALDQLAAVRRAVLRIPTTRNVAVTVGTVNKLGSIPVDGERANGGPVWPTGSFLVGEHGPELFTPATRGSILPAGPTAASLAAGPSSMRSAGGTTSGAVGGDTYDIKVIETRNARETAREVLVAGRRARFEKAGAW